MIWRIALVLLAIACQKTELPQENVSFRRHVVPLLKRDCAACHEGGQYRVRIRGEPSDYPHIRHYLLIPDAGSPHATVVAEDSLLLQFAAGGTGIL